ncbi:hypothetical protein B0H19DRAFT_1248340 [Mycena capillaripes]|nr:hypothetical protein B0H19DRAFT_1248340 [Mycena capillaripes]
MKTRPTLDSVSALYLSPWPALDSLLEACANYNITFDTNFPEPELSNALRIVKKEIYGDRDLNKERLPWPDLMEAVEHARDVLWQFRVPDELIDDRMEAMGMLHVWRGIGETFPYTPGSCLTQRAPGDTSTGDNNLSPTASHTASLTIISASLNCATLEPRDPMLHSFLQSTSLPRSSSSLATPLVSKYVVSSIVPSLFYATAALWLRSHPAGLVPHIDPSLLPTGTKK